MVSLVLLSTHSPSKLASDLEIAGYRVHEALEVSEVLHVCEYENIDAVVIAPDVADQDMVEVQLRQMTITLKPKATIKDLVWELIQLFPDKTVLIQ